jgi:hypothetical protein
MVIELRSTIDDLVEGGAKGAFFLNAITGHSKSRTVCIWEGMA